MNPLTKNQIILLDKFEIIKHYRPDWLFNECIYFMLKELATVNPNKIDLLNKCNEILS